MQGISVLSVVIAYELVRRYSIRAAAAHGRPGPRGRTAHRGSRGRSPDGDRRDAAADSGDVVKTVAVQRRRVSLTGWRLAFALLRRHRCRVVRPDHHRRRPDRLRRDHQRCASGWPSRSAWPVSAGLWSERAGVVNIGLEGMMILGTWGAGWAGSTWGPWTGLLVGCAHGRGRWPGARHRDRHLRRRPDRVRRRHQPRRARHHPVPVRGGVPCGQPTQSPEIPARRAPSRSRDQRLADSVEEHGWFFVSDVAGFVRAVTFQVPYSTIIAVVLLPLTFFLLWRTAVRAAAALLRRGAVRRRDPGRQRLPVQVHRRDRLGRCSPASAARSSRSSPPGSTARARPPARASSAWPR